MLGVLSTVRCWTSLTTLPQPQPQPTHPPPGRKLARKIVTQFHKVNDAMAVLDGDGTLDAQAKAEKEKEYVDPT